MKKIWILLLFAMALIVNVFFGFHKSGFHEDEYYTYFSSNRSIGLYQPDRQWQDRQEILDEFAVKEGEGFNYGLVKLVQSWDVHPPFYYYVFHTLCSFVPGIFSKLPGIISNLIAFAISFWILAGLLKKLGMSQGGLLITLAFWGINPMTISCNMLIRMYAWLTAWIFACAFLHIRMIQSFQKGKNKADDKMKSFVKFGTGNFLPIGVVSFFGFLTQYFYLFFFVSIGFAFTCWVFFWRKEIRLALSYVATCAISLLLAVLYYPASVHHLLGGYRGNEATESLFDVGNTIMRFSFFSGLLNDFVFSGALIILLAVIVISIIVSNTYLARKDNDARTALKPEPAVIILAFGVLGYFLLTAKSALLVGSASNRYEMPIYGLIITLLFLIIDVIITALCDEKISIAVYAVLAAICFAIVVKGIAIDQNVLFLYPQDREKIEYASEHLDSTAVVMFNPATPHNVWRLTDELLVYPKVFYMDEENLEPLSEKEIAELKNVSGGDVVLYAADNDLRDAAIEVFMDEMGLKEASVVSTEDMWSTYELK